MLTLCALQMLVLLLLLLLTDAITDYASQVAVIGGNRICLKLHVAFITKEWVAKLGMV